MKLNFLNIILVLLLFTKAASAVAAEYDHTIETKGLTFSWKIDGNNINVKLRATTTGWVAVGFNPIKHMLGANFILGSIDNGKVMTSDEFGVRETAHEPDTAIGGTNNVTNVSGEETRRETEIRFTTPLNSGDDADGEIKTNQFIPIAFAYSARNDNFKTRHFYRTTILVNLSTGESKSP